MLPKKLVFDAHAGRRCKQRRIPKAVVTQIATYGHVVKTERIANWVTKIYRGDYQGQPIHVVVKGNIIKTVYFADEWECQVRVLKRHKGVRLVANS